MLSVSLALFKIFYRWSHRICHLLYSVTLLCSLFVRLLLVCIVVVNCFSTPWFSIVYIFGFQFFSYCKWYHSEFFYRFLSDYMHILCVCLGVKLLALMYSYDQLNSYQEIVFKKKYDFPPSSAYVLQFLPSSPTQLSGYFILAILG